MARGTMKRYLSMCLVVVMLLTTLLPVSAYAADDSAIEDTATNYEEPVASELEDVSVELEDQESEQVDDTSAVTEISDYATFLSCFKVLEGYAQTYTEENAGEDANALIINYIRTGGAVHLRHLGNGLRQGEYCLHRLRFRAGYREQHLGFCAEEIGQLHIAQWQ